uniref:Uncharacterized protein n=1 Tax=Candidatus Kentrum eta TaxID=2126337 RepID=A0A450UAW9_9GAMM|nr:MAG: hypothetical protein BECKH772A_GA0070896_1000424 [Candidatus Kentron sp. H]VFJ89370.1 MAG: hypothetical protein BECKH772B_GA0070898_1000424 [Candidatus Kentron sp. H]VFJ95949.1 MAG: hypothetical protein BECKH772C_GA0070978_1000425 [Candidatus Kentron sp. H]
MCRLIHARRSRNKKTEYRGYCVKIWHNHDLLTTGKLRLVLAYWFFVLYS